MLETFLNFYKTLNIKISSSTFREKKGGSDFTSLPLSHSRRKRKRFFAEEGCAQRDDEKKQRGFYEIKNVVKTRETIAQTRERFAVGRAHSQAQIEETKEELEGKEGEVESGGTEEVGVNGRASGRESADGEEEETFGVFCDRVER